MQNTWLLVANGSGGRLFNREGRHLSLVAEFTHPEGRSKRADLASDRPGSFHGSGAGPGSYMQATDPKSHEMEHYAQRLVETLEHGRTGNRFAELELVAPPHLHGLLRKTMPAQLSKMVVTDIEKDYTAIAERDLLDTLGGQLLH